VTIIMSITVTVWVSLSAIYDL